MTLVPTSAVLQPFLEAGDGDHPSGTAERWQVDIGQRDCGNRAVPICLPICPPAEEQATTVDAVLEGSAWPRSSHSPLPSVASSTWRRPSPHHLCFAVGPLRRRHDSHCWVQYAEGQQRKGARSHCPHLVGILTTAYRNELAKVAHSSSSLRAVTALRLAQVSIKMWDLGGQPRFRGMWERYCANVSAIVYVVDAADHKNVDISREELHELISKPSLKAPKALINNRPSQFPCNFRTHPSWSLATSATCRRLSRRRRSSSDCESWPPLPTSAVLSLPVRRIHAGNLRISRIVRLVSTPSQPRTRYSLPLHSRGDG